MQCAVPNITGGLASEASDICPLKQYYRPKNKESAMREFTRHSPRMRRTIECRLHAAYSGDNLLHRLRGSGRFAPDYVRAVRPPGWVDQFIR